MKRYFIDANILIDFLACRLPFAHHAQQIFEAAEQGRIKVFVSSNSIASVYYVLRKYSEEKQLRKAILALMENSSVIALNDEMIVRSLRSDWKDVEDAMQLECAYSIRNLDGIVTRNIKDFKGAKVPVLGPERVLAF